MAKRSEVVVLSRGERLRDSNRQSTSMAMPLAIHHRLDLLAEAARDVDATRAEIIAMLIAQASLDSDELERAVLLYRKLKVGDVLPDDEPAVETPADPAESDNVVSITPRGPGRPTRHGSA